MNTRCWKKSSREAGTGEGLRGVKEGVENNLVISSFCFCCWFINLSSCCLCCWRGERVGEGEREGAEEGTTEDERGVVEEDPIFLRNFAFSSAIAAKVTLCEGGRGEGRRGGMGEGEGREREDIHSKN
jgi:hypothetical protein